MVYIKKDTPVAHIHKEDVSCEYLEVNEIVEGTQGINWQPPCNRKIVNPDLVYSPTQITEHHRVELKDHECIRRNQTTVSGTEGQVSQGVFIK